LKKDFVLRMMLLPSLLALGTWAAPAPNRAAIYHRIVCVVPMVGSGTAKDPKRPLFTPSSSTAQEAPKPPGHGKWEKQPDTRIIAFQSVPTDDGKASIVMFVARSYQAFKPILSDPRVIEKFERKEIRERDLVTALRRYKKHFDLKQLQVGGL
jgi:hypothetical protein